MTFLSDPCGALAWGPIPGRRGNQVPTTSVPRPPPGGNLRPLPELPMSEDPRHRGRGTRASATEQLSLMSSAADHEAPVSAAAWGLPDGSDADPGQVSPIRLQRGG